MLDKRLKLGGLQVGSPRTMQNVARFRVANNVYQTRDDLMVPRFHSSLLRTLDSANSPEIHTLASYNRDTFSIARNNATNKMQFFYQGTKIPMFGIAASDFSAIGESNGMGPQCIEKLGNLYINFPYYGLYKYDGVQAYKAGVPLPWLSSAQNNTAGTAFMRVIQHHLDFQGNVVNSGYVDFRANPAANIVNIRTDKGASDIVANYLSTGASPTVRTSALDGNYDEHYWVATGVGVNDGLGNCRIPTGGDHNVAIGAYVICSTTRIGSTVSFDVPFATQAIAVKVVSTDATGVTVSLSNVKYLDLTGSWQTGSLPATSSFLEVTTRSGTNYYFSCWTSNVATGNYVLRMIGPVFYQSGTSKTFAVDCTSLIVPNATYAQNPFNLSGNLGDIYDVTTVKDVFPYFSTYNVSEFPLSFTTYGDLAVISDDSNPRFSDTSLGGSFEMVSGLSFITVGSGSDGKVQAVCGNEDFLLVSRQNKNYYVAGNLPTANYKVSSIKGTSMGAYSNESCIAYEDVIIFMNCQGIWGLYGGARCDEISVNIRGLFQDWSETFQWEEELYFDISTYPEFITLFTYPNKWVRVRADKQRGLIFFLISGPTKHGVALVLNMNNGEFYTWSDFQAAQALTTPNVKDLLFIDGSFYSAINSMNGVLYKAEIYKELKTGANKYAYETESPVELDTSWFTAGEPSLEKKLNQVKMWGRITAPVAISHYLDWSSTEIPDDSYTNPSNIPFSHKSRLSSNNFQAVSVSLRPVLGSFRFELEGLEIEFQPLQMGMKR